MKHEHVWTWPIAGYLFLGGLGAGMAIFTALGDLFLGMPYVFLPCAAGSLVALGLGSFLLIFELGRPTQFWRVFSKQKAILTFGAWMVVALIIFDLMYFSFWFDFVPWNTVSAFRMVIGVICLLLGLGVMLYTGIELSSMKARVFWNTPALPIVFALSGLLVGAAADFLMISFWPYAGFSSLGIMIELGLQQAIAAAQGLLVAVMALLDVLTLIGVLVYVLMMYTSSTAGSRKAAKRWLSGSYALAFWLGLVLVGLVVPLVLIALYTLASIIVATICIIIGGVFLRFLVVYSDDRRVLHEEDTYWKRLPEGSELFMKADW